MRRDCTHRGPCRSCLLAALQKVNDVAWDLEEFKARRIRDFSL
jgi:hypothetical protein